MEELRPHFLPILLGTFGLIFVSLGLYQLASSKKPEPDLKFEAGQSIEKNQNVMADVEGAVISPGIFKLKAESRMVDALAAAGGLSEEADRVWVEKNINLASRISDGQKIYIPREGEEILSGSSAGAGPVLNINTASQSDLEALPGIGAVTAAKIIEARPIGKIEDLLNQKIVGLKTFDQIKAKITTY